jgi:hypothetical protein
MSVVETTYSRREPLAQGRPSGKLGPDRTSTRTGPFPLKDETPAAAEKEEKRDTAGVQVLLLDISLSGTTRTDSIVPRPWSDQCLFLGESR